jgi:hypothetical protein
LSIAQIERRWLRFATTVHLGLSASLTVRTSLMSMVREEVKAPASWRTKVRHCPHIALNRHRAATAETLGSRSRSLTALVHHAQPDGRFDALAGNDPKSTKAAAILPGCGRRRISHATVPQDGLGSEMGAEQVSLIQLGRMSRYLLDGNNAEYHEQSSRDAIPRIMNHYTLKHRILAAVSQRLFTNNVYVAKRGLTVGLRRKGGLGFVPTWLQSIAVFAR